MLKLPWPILLVVGVALCSALISPARAAENTPTSQVYLPYVAASVETCLPTDQPIQTVEDSEGICLEVGAKLELTALFTGNSEILGLENMGSFTNDHNWVELTYPDSLKDIIERRYIRGLRWTNFRDGKVFVAYNKPTWKFTLLQRPAI